MEPNIKLLLINHSFQVRYFYTRWQKLAQAHPNLDVTLLAPDECKWYNSKSYTYGGGGSIIKGKEVEDRNFHIRLVRKKDIHGSDWYSPDFKAAFKDIQPDIIYHIGGHIQLSMIQTIRLAKKYCPNSKIIGFSMRGPHHNLHNRIIKGFSTSAIKSWLSFLYSYPRLKYVNKNVDAFFCHYPDALKAFKDEGFTKPIYMQTQVGFNKEWFHPDSKSRQEIREKYNLGDAFVFGSATRFTWDKGLDDILAALPEEGNWKYLMMGSGNESDKIRLLDTIKKRHLEDKVIMTGFVDWYDMAKYWNAIDCALHVPRTTYHWVETFSLSVVQAMATGKPIIGSDSGSVPYQIGPDGIIIKEGDISRLSEEMRWVMNHPEESKEIGNKLMIRAINSFEILHLNELFYATIIDLLNGIYDEKKVDMAKIF